MESINEGALVSEFPVRRLEGHVISADELIPDQTQHRPSGTEAMEVQADVTSKPCQEEFVSAADAAGLPVPPSHAPSFQLKYRNDIPF